MIPCSRIEVYFAASVYNYSPILFPMRIGRFLLLAGFQGGVSSDKLGHEVHQHHAQNRHQGGI